MRTRVSRHWGECSRSTLVLKRFERMMDLHLPARSFRAAVPAGSIRLVRAILGAIPYWPQMSELVERRNQGMLRALRVARSLWEDWRRALEDCVYSCSTAPHSVAGGSPMELLTGGPVRDLLPSLALHCGGGCAPISDSTPKGQM